MKSVFSGRFLKGFLIFSALITIYLIGWYAFPHSKEGCKEHAADPIICSHFAFSDHLETEEDAGNINDDLLIYLIKKPEQLKFVNSKIGSRQVVLEANYRVSGADAHLIEDILRKEYGMSELKFVCCGWESYPGGKQEITDKFNDKYGKQYDYNHIPVSMYSQETLIQDRKEWHKIPYFYVVVEVLNI